MAEGPQKGDGVPEQGLDTKEAAARWWKRQLGGQRGLPFLLSYLSANKGPPSVGGSRKDQNEHKSIPETLVPALRQPDPETDRPDLEQSHW